MTRVFAILLLLSAFTSRAQIDLDAGLILYYPLDGNSYDAGPSGLDGIPSVTWVSDYQGNVTGAAEFNGSTSYIDFPEDPSLKPQLPLTFAFYVKLNSPNVQQGWIFSTNYTQNSYRGVFCNIDDAKIQFSYGDGDVNVTNGGSRQTKTCSKQLIVGQWHYVVGVIRGASDMSIYIDCVDEGGTYSGMGGPMSYDNNPGSLGRGDVAGFSPYYLNGGIDDFRYWNRALSHEEVMALCDLVSGVKDVQKESEKSLAFYPNPVEGNLIIPLIKQDIGSVTQVNLVDLQGRIIKTLNYKVSAGMNSCQFDLSSVPSGAYIVQLMNPNRKQTQMILVD